MPPASIKSANRIDGFRPPDLPASSRAGAGARSPTGIVGAEQATSQTFQHEARLSDGLTERRALGIV
jgi:hypothetical protein